MNLYFIVNAIFSTEEKTYRLWHGPFFNAAPESNCVILSFHAATTMDHPLILPICPQAGVSAGRGPQVADGFKTAQTRDKILVRICSTGCD